MPEPLFTPPPDAASSPCGPSAHHVRLAGDGTGFEAPDSQTLLVSAEAAGLPWPSSCRNGTCRTCIALVLEGRVVYRVEWPGLSAEEKREGWVLPCVAHPATDLVLQFTDA